MVNCQRQVNFRIAQNFYWLGQQRAGALARADVELTKLRFYLRLCRDMNLLKLNQYHHAAEMVAEIGRLLGGWRKTVSQPQ